MRPKEFGLCGRLGAVPGRAADEPALVELEEGWPGGCKDVFRLGLCDRL